MHHCISLKVRKSRKDFFKITFPPKNEPTNSTLLVWNLWSTCFRSVFWRKLKTPKRHFEIIWPLAGPVSSLKTFLQLCRPAQYHKEALSKLKDNEIELILSQFAAVYYTYFCTMYWYQSFKSYMATKSIKS